MGQISNILEGWTNFMVKSEVTEHLAGERAKHCSVCPHAKDRMLLSFLNDELKEIQGMGCNICGCPISAKIRSINEKCPLGLW
jgi:hypothetical protein